MNRALAVVLALWAHEAWADFTYLSQSGTASASYSAGLSQPPSGSASWTEPSGFVDYSQTISTSSPPFGYLQTTCTMAAKFHGTFLEIDGTAYSNGAQAVASTDQTSGVQSRSITFRNDTAQTWPIVGNLSISGNFTEKNGPTFASSAAYSLKGSDGSDIELSPTSVTDFTGQINPFVTYTLKVTASESLTGPILGSGTRFSKGTFSVQIGTEVPEPPALALALAGMLVGACAASRRIRRQQRL